MDQDHMGQGGSRSAPWFDAAGTGGDRVAEEWLMGTEGGAGGEPEDVVAFAARVYDEAVHIAPTFRLLLDAALVGVRLGLVKEGRYPLTQAEKHGDERVTLVWPEGMVETVPIPDRMDSPRSPEALRFLERLGHAVLRSDVHFPVDTLHLTPLDYKRWADGDHVALDRWQPLPPGRRARSASCITPLLEWFECQRRAAGAVGWYWCLPMLHLVVWSRGAAPRPAPPPLVLVRRSVDCPPDDVNLHVVVPLKENLCPGLPAGCAVRFRHWRAGTWRAHAPLVQHLGRTVCFSLPGLAWGARERLCPRRREDRYFPVDEDDDDLVVCVVAGRLPLALAGFCPVGRHPNRHYVTALCALTGGRGGSLLVDWLQRWVSQQPHGSLSLSADRSVTAFYRRHGFRPRSDGDEDELRWYPPRGRSTKRALEGEDGRSSQADCCPAHGRHVAHAMCAPRPPVRRPRVAPGARCAGGAARPPTGVPRRLAAERWGPSENLKTPTCYAKAAAGSWCCRSRTDGPH